MKRVKKDQSVPLFRQFAGDEKHGNLSGGDQFTPRLATSVRDKVEVETGKWAGFVGYIPANSPDIEDAPEE